MIISKGKLTARLRSIVTLLLICNIFCLLAGCVSRTNTADGQLYGTVISNGEINGTLELPIQMSLSSGVADAGIQELTIVLPEAFRYSFTDSSAFQDWMPMEFAEHYPVYGGYSYSNDTNEAVFSVFAISPDQKYAIFNWEDGTDLYLVASADPEQDPMEIYDYFRFFRETVNLDD